ncbi:MAG: hypothetical protein ACW98K_14545 [Candidatus Kariarchaeaceae archaeon]|jgi:hypothetical protein
MKDKSLLISTLRKLGKAMIEKTEIISIHVPYHSWKHFGETILDLAQQLEEGSENAKIELKMIFLPTSDWDDSGGIKGFDPDLILRLLNEE